MVTWRRSGEGARSPPRTSDAYAPPADRRSMKVVANRRNARGPRRVAGGGVAPLPAVAGHLAAQAEHAIERADAKAATLAATATAILAFAVQGGRPPGCGEQPAATVALALAALCWIAGIVALAAAIFPRFE